MVILQFWDSYYANLRFKSTKIWILDVMTEINHLHCIALDDSQLILLSAAQDTASQHVRRKRAVLSDDDMIVELAVYADADYTATLGVTDLQKRVELMLVKYNGVCI